MRLMRLLFFSLALLYSHNLRALDEYEFCVDAWGEGFQYGPNPFEISFGTCQGRGIGYNRGYSTIGFLFTPTFDYDSGQQYFFDLRGHIFNNGKPALNTGIGVRYISDCMDRVFGFNAYYDYRQGHRKGFNQLGVGFEMLGPSWDLRLNGYIPIGKKQSEFGHTLFIYPDNLFAKCNKRQKVMSGFDLELGIPLRKPDSCKNIGFYAAFGTYYFSPYQRGRDMWGGKIRVAAQVWDYFDIEVKGTFDRVFKNRVEGCLTFTYPFGDRPCLPYDACCEDSYNLKEIASQPVVRQEMIVFNPESRACETNFGRRSNRHSTGSSSYTYDSESYESFDSEYDSSEVFFIESSSSD